MRCKLTKLYSAHRAVRTDEVVGSCDNPPEVGQSFTMFAPPLDKRADIRAIKTTKVLEMVEIHNGVEFKTLNSDYRWKSL